MFVTHYAAIGLVIIGLGSIAIAAASGSAHAQDGSNGNSGASAPVNRGVGGATGMFQQAQGYGRAPIGHRQPRPGDIPDPELSPSDRALRQEDERIDRKLIICRGC